MDKSECSITEEQHAYIVFDQKEDTKLLATAGSGKTFCIIQHMKHLLQRHVYAPSEMYMLTFSRNARDDFLQKMHKQGLTNVPSQNIHTIDSFAWSILGKEVASSIDVSILSYAMLRILQSLDGKNHDIDTVFHASPQHFMDKLQNVRCVFVDEAQDLNDIQYSILLLLKKHCHAQLHFIGDPNQNIYQFRRSCDKFLIQHPAKIFYLTKNFRSQPHIVEFCSYLRPYNTIPLCIGPNTTMTNGSQQQHIPHKLKVTFYPYENTHSFEHYLLSILHHFIAKQIPLHKVTILAPTRGYLRCTNGLHNYKGLCYIANLLFKNDIPFQQFYNDMGSDTSFVQDQSASGSSSASSSGGMDASKINYKIKKNHINLMTCTASKGLEWDYVIIIDANAFLVTPKNHYDREKYLAEQYLLYVACSRPRKNLIIFSKQKCINPWFKNVPVENYKLAPNKPDMKELIFYDASKLFDKNGGNDVPKSHDIILKSRINEMTEQEMYDLYTIIKPCLVEKQDYIMCDAENMHFWKCKAPDTKKTLMSKFLEYLFYVLCFQDALADSLYLKDVSNIAYSENIIFCDNEHVIFWYFSHREGMTWEQYDAQKTKMNPKVCAFIEGNFDRNLPFHIYTLVDTFFDTFILKNRARIKECYEKHLLYPYHIRQVLFLTLISHALRTTHYFYINIFESFYTDIVKKNKTFFLLLDTYCKKECMEKIVKFKEKVAHAVPSIVSEIDLTLMRPTTTSHNSLVEVPCKLVCNGQEKLKDIIYMILTTRIWKESQSQDTQGLTFHTICLQKGLETKWTYDVPHHIYQDILQKVIAT